MSANLSDVRKESLQAHIPACEWCNDTGLMRLLVVACCWPIRGQIEYLTEPVRWTSTEDTNTRVTCYCRNTRRTL